MTDTESNLKKYIRDISNWPKQGILFRDITPLLNDARAFSDAVKALTKDFENEKIDYVAAIEARGFIFGSAVAEHLKAGFVPIRKKGKLPFNTETYTYNLEYGQDTLEVHIDAVKKGSKVLMVDDLLATGGTMSAGCKLIEKLGGRIAGISFLIELSELKGCEKLSGYKIRTVLKY